MTSRSVGYSLANRALRSTTPPSVTAPYFGDPLTVKVARQEGVIQISIPLKSSLRAQRSNPGGNKQGRDCFVASAPRNDRQPGSNPLALMTATAPGVFR